MGLFDSLLLLCPNCGYRLEFQSKAGECSMATYHSFDATPAVILVDLLGETAPCSDCGGRYSIDGRLTLESCLGKTSRKWTEKLSLAVVSPGLPPFRDGFKKRNIKLTTGGGGRSVRAEVIGSLGVHSNQITHIPTGYTLVGDFKCGAEARRVAAWLVSESRVDWEFTDASKTPVGAREAITAAKANCTPTVQRDQEHQ